MNLPQSCHELLAVDDETGVFAFTDEALFVGCRDGKLQLASLYLNEGGCGSDGAAMSGGLEVRNSDVSAYGGLAIFYVGCHAMHRSLFHEGYHGWGGEYAQVAAAYVGCKVMLLDDASAGMGKSVL